MKLANRTNSWTPHYAEKINYRIAPNLFCVEAFVCVRCPRTGNPEKWRKPRKHLIFFKKAIDKCTSRACNPRSLNHFSTICCISKTSTSVNWLADSVNDMPKLLHKRRAWLTDKDHFCWIKNRVTYFLFVLVVYILSYLYKRAARNS